MSWVDKMKKGLSKAAGEAGDLAQVSKIHMQIRKLDSQKRDLLTEVGEKVYEAHRKGTVDATVEALYEAIEKLDEEIAEKEEEIERIKVATQEEREAEGQEAEGQEEEEEEREGEARGT